MNDERIAEHAAEVIAWLHSEEALGWTYNDLELRLRLAIRGALADPNLSDQSRRIAELEQANRDLERLRAEASREGDEARERVAVLEKVGTAMDHQFQAASQQADQFAECLNRCCAEKVELREQLTAAQEHRRILHEALQPLVDRGRFAFPSEDAIANGKKALAATEGHHNGK